MNNIFMLCILWTSIIGRCDKSVYCSLARMLCLVLQVKKNRHCYTYLKIIIHEYSTYELILFPNVPTMSLLKAYVECIDFNGNHNCPS